MSRGDCARAPPRHGSRLRAADLLRLLVCPGCSAQQFLLCSNRLDFFIIFFNTFVPCP
jgi:hypothetical protein